MSIKKYRQINTTSTPYNFYEPLIVFAILPKNLMVELAQKHLVLMLEASKWPRHLLLINLEVAHWPQWYATPLDLSRPNFWPLRSSHEQRQDFLVLFLWPQLYFHWGPGLEADRQPLFLSEILGQTVIFWR